MPIKYKNFSTYYFRRYPKCRLKISGTISGIINFKRFVKYQLFENQNFDQLASHFFLNFA